MESKTKIVATIGPSCQNKDIIIELIKHHLDIARLNFSWDTHEGHKIIIDHIRNASKEAGRMIEIIQDLSGPRVQEKSGHHFGGEDNTEVITEKDKDDLAFGIKEKVDYIALSFVSGAKDIIELKNLIKELGGNQKIIAKIERKIAYENLDEILEITDGVMVARGDLGIEYPLEEIPFIQHQIIERANKKGRFVIVATEMMIGMVNNPRPTRAEVSDVAYAIIDGADAVMLSEESAIGKFPIETVAMMEKIALAAEKHLLKKDISI
ncbi:MAG: pyruvate kinase [Candidatus Paceibacterota bacterium]|jgi:pyruvate kinase